MGCLCPRRASQIIQVQSLCPKCGQIFPAKTQIRMFNLHLDICLQNSVVVNIQQSQQIYLNVNQFEADQQDYRNFSFWEKVQDELHSAQFKWKKNKCEQLDVRAIRDKSEIVIQAQYNLLKDIRQSQFVSRLESLRVPWQEGCTHVEISLQNLLETSMKGLSTISEKQLHGELKVTLQEDSKVHDAGGLLREWIGMVIHTLIERGCLKRSNTDELMYHFTTEPKADEFQLLGFLTGKALFEKIPINSFFVRTIIKQILGLHVDLDDFKFYDQNVYSSYKYLIDNVVDPLELMLYFSIDDQGQVINLKENGQNIIVNEDNKHEYINLSIQYYVSQSVKVNLDAFLKSFYEVIPQNLINVFTSDEVEMVLFGVPFINIDDWKLHTKYKGEYNQDHQVIKWFWEVLAGYSQSELSRFFHFCTGSSRTPVEGFKHLQSNRGEIRLFCIESSKYTIQNPFPKAHTCFNRLDLPLYEIQIIYEQSYFSKDQLEMNLRATLDVVLLGQFGLD